MLFGLLAASPAPDWHRISASNLRPAPGELVTLEASYDGPWPAALDWVGVDRAEGARAELLARAPGPLRVSVELDGRTEVLELEVQPTENRGWVEPGSVQVRSLPALFGECQDARFPRLAGHWAVGCGPSGLVDRAVDLRDNRLVTLDAGSPSPATAPGLLYAPGVGLRRLPEPGAVAGVHRLPEAGVLSVGTDGERVAATTSADVQVFSFFGADRQHYTARPAPWYPPALSSLGVAWVDLAEAELTGEDIRWLPTGALRSVPLVRRAGHQRHVAADGPFVGWIEDDGVRVEDLRSGERRFYAADAHTSTGLSLWGPVACFEVFSADVDLSCTDGLVVSRPGHQRSPSRYGPWLLFREGAQVLVATMPTLTLDDDDPRAQPSGPRVPEPTALRGARLRDGVAYSLTLPAVRWAIERWEGGAWVPAGESAGGAVELVAPAGDAVRFRLEDAL